MSSNTIRNVGNVSKSGFGHCDGPLNMLSKMGGRMIAFYADDLAELMLNDFLAETAQELQKIEALEVKSYKEGEVKELADEILDQLATYQA